MSTNESSSKPASLSPTIEMRADEIGNEVYASHYAERRTYQVLLVCGTVILLSSLFVNLSLARRPVANRYIRIDEMGRAQAIQYTDLNYSPREGEVRTYLTDWATDRYTLNREAMTRTYPRNFYFLSQSLAAQSMAADTENHFVSQILSGQTEPSDVQVRDVTITSMSQERIQGATIARGTALIALDRVYTERTSREPRTEHWLVSATYYLDPRQVNDASRLFPQFETINPLGLTITEFHENRVSVEPIAPGNTGANPNAIAQPLAGATR